MNQKAKKGFARMLSDIYGKNQYKLEVFHAPGPGKKNFAIICPGGGYMYAMSYGEGEPFATELNRQGITAFVLKYRTRKAGRFPAPMNDLARAVKEILDNAEQLNVKTEGYSVWGSSAGGHLAACFGTENIGWKHYGLPRPSALILCYPVITMGAKTHKYSRINLLGKEPAEELVSLTSVEQHVTEQYPPTYVWCCDDDNTVDPQNSEMLCSALKNAGVTHEYSRFASGGHGCGLAKGKACQGWFMQAIEFWKKQM